jgi:hypothetical protein
MKIKKKTWPGAFEKILSGEKTFDARLANFDCKPGDILVLEEYDSARKKYTGRKIEKKITFVLNTKKQKYWSQTDINKVGLQIIAFKSPSN